MEETENTIVELPEKEIQQTTMFQNGSYVYIMINICVHFLKNAATFATT